MRKAVKSLARGEAEAMAAEALGFLAGDPERLSRFLDMTGVDPGAIRQEAARPDFLSAVMEHVMADESLLLAFAANQGAPPERVAAAAAALGIRPWERDEA